MKALDRRIRKLEANRPSKREVRWRDTFKWDPLVVAMWAAADFDVNNMNLAQLRILEAEIMRFA